MCHANCCCAGPGWLADCLRSGTMPLLEAAVQWYGERYGVKLDAKGEALLLIGSQEGLGEMPALIVHRETDGC